MRFALIFLMMLTWYASANVDQITELSERTINPVVKIMPPPGFMLMPGGWEMTGYPFRDLFEHPAEWPLTRASIDYLGSIDYVLDEENFSDIELESYFSSLNSWGIDLFIETPVIKEWSGWSEELVWQADTTRWGRLEDCGAVISQLVMDEPFVCTKYHYLENYDWAAGVVFRWMCKVRERYDGVNLPEVSLVLMEGYPCFSVSELLGFVDSIQEKCYAAGIDGIDVFCLDPDWCWGDFETYGWDGIRAIQDSIRARNIEFSLLFWASEHKRSLTDSLWHSDIMHQGSRCRQFGIRPDEYLIQSYIKIPRVTVPESTLFSFTNSFRTFYNTYIAWSPYPMPVGQTESTLSSSVTISSTGSSDGTSYSATITIAAASDVTVEVYDLVGRLVSTSAIQNSSPGSHQVALDLTDCNTGIYLLNCRACGQAATSRLYVLR